MGAGEFIVCFIESISTTFEISIFASLVHNPCNFEVMPCVSPVLLTREPPRAPEIYHQKLFKCLPFVQIGIKA
jgi:hypothetical protein